MAASLKSGSVPSEQSLPPPCPKSPPDTPYLYGKRRGIAKVQMLDREIRHLEDELKSVEGLQPASKCCKEVAEFVVAKSDPLISTNRKNGRSSCRFWLWPCGIPCFSFSWICSCWPHCCDCNPFNCCSCPSCPHCAAPKLHCCSCSCPRSQCCTDISCCKCKFPSCPDCSCCTWTSCPNVRFSCNCTKSCCSPRSPLL
ncbi:hypothetical protein K2173_017410 [Erythroxylum novogranatense]|uniref:G protein gamma domain-containing protein n=1 Tax=Erythroxylum novogranatense TaxID=1862640 RepID=A0AAV8TKE6_9ROSI|nr:hypothetical protein K2173_017410 [Erythroxylum novogranatense]